jgi:hypothetical protein
MHKSRTCMALHADVDIYVQRKYDECVKATLASMAITKALPSA